MKNHNTELHAHSAETSRCGLVAADELVKKYSEAGYSTVVLTDHYYERFFVKFRQQSWSEKLAKYLKGYRTACQTAKEIGLNILLGLEIRFINQKNEYLVYGLTEKFLRENPELHKKNLSELRKLVDQQPDPVLIFQAHPYRRGMKPVAIDLLDGLEVYNGNPRHDSHNQQALAFARDNGLKMVSGSDFHQLEDLARGGITTEKEIKNSKQLIEVLKTNNYQLISHA
ncbi:PHP domain-containing protein [Halanaerobium salsuginis]|uniref:PHP domain-containing protein n=1 Tax=Halanaerobium salsuginis TaxID=29563 RepID=A0A1I4H265_9FIRM|nr:PHP domain-containing protein [Halanaerobium salsuginis]SFL36275.1 hypothetical protein SAMN02983006_00952 [Halanaerobium salsuginis]